MRFKLFIVLSLLIALLCSCSQTPSSPPEIIHNPENPCNEYCSICHPERLQENYRFYADADLDFCRKSDYLITDNTSIKRITFNDVERDRRVSRLMNYDDTYEGKIKIEIWNLPVGQSFNDPEFYENVRADAETRLTEYLGNIYDNLSKDEKSRESKECFIDSGSYLGCYDDVTEALYYVTQISNKSDYMEHMPANLIYEGTVKTGYCYEKRSGVYEWNAYGYMNICDLSLTNYECKDGKVSFIGDKSLTRFYDEEAKKYWADNGYAISQTIYDSYLLLADNYEGYAKFVSGTSWETSPSDCENTTLKTSICTMEEALSNASLLANNLTLES